MRLTKSSSCHHDRNDTPFKSHLEVEAANKGLQSAMSREGEQNLLQNNYVQGVYLYSFETGRLPTIQQIFKECPSG